MREVAPGHFVACHFPLQAVAEPTPVPVSEPAPSPTTTAEATRPRRTVRRRRNGLKAGTMATRSAEAPRARTRLDPSVRRASILDAAERVFAGRNPADVTFEEVAEAASVSRGLVYNYFGDKAGLITAIYLRTFERLDAAMLEGLDDRDPRGGGEAALRAVVGAYLRFAAENQVAWRLIGAAEATAHPVVQAARQERFRRMAEAWGGTPQALVLAGGVVGFLEAATLTWLDSPGITVEGVTDLMTRMIWGGVSSLDDANGVHLPPRDDLRPVDLRAPRRRPRRRPVRLTGPCVPDGFRRWCPPRASSTRRRRCGPGGRDRRAPRAHPGWGAPGGPTPWRSRCARRGRRWATRRAGAG